MLAKSFRTCAPLEAEAEAEGLVAWLQEPWSYLAMGNFPYASSYLVHGQGMLPAFPVRAACRPLDALPPQPSPRQLLVAARQAVSVFYNFSKTEKCFYNAPAHRPPAPVKARVMAPRYGRTRCSRTDQARWLRSPRASCCACRTP